MSHLTIHELPQLRQSVLISGFKGWADAGEVASGAVRFLRRTLRSRKFAEIDPQPFYDFTTIRPTSRVVGHGRRELTWPSCSFSYCKTDGERDLVLFLAPEPQLQWLAYVGAIFELIERLDVRMLVSLGGTYDAVAHSRPTVVSGYATQSVLQERLQRLGVRFSEYEGPSSIQSALMQAAYDRQILAVSLFGHAPHYVTNVPNPKVSYGLLARAAELLDFTWDLSELQRAAVDFTIQVGLAIEEQPELKDYVRRLEASEARHSEQGEASDDQPGLPPELPPTEMLVQDLEDYLRKLQQKSEE